MVFGVYNEAQLATHNKHLQCLTYGIHPHSRRDLQHTLCFPERASAACITLTCCHPHASLPTFSQCDNTLADRTFWFIVDASNGTPLRAFVAARGNVRNISLAVAVCTVLVASVLVPGASNGCASVFVVSEITITCKIDDRTRML